MSPGLALSEGYLVSGRFQLLRLLGRGGMGSVWVARHLSLNIDVALKFIEEVTRGAPSARDDARSRFAQEARTAARIQSPHVVNILDYGFDGDRPYIAMELLHGDSLSARLERDGRLHVAEVSAILTQTAKGLAKAHALGIVHRDLKPDNLFLVREEDGGVHVKILDFGIARDEAPLGAASHRTATGELLGTPAYMSPEQVLARSPIDFRSDLYALAVVVYHCVLGRLPFESDALAELIVSISTREPPPPSSLGLAGVPSGLDAWFRRAFQKDPAARFGSAKEMADVFALACREASLAYDRTVLADDRATARELPRWTTPAPLPPPGGLAPGVTVNAQIVGVRPPSPSAAPRVPDTFVGQYATQGSPLPKLPTRGPPPLVFGLIGLIVVAGVSGGGLYAMRMSATHPESGPAGLVDAAAEASSPVAAATSSPASVSSTISPLPVSAASAKPPDSAAVRVAEPRHPPAPSAVAKPTPSVPPVPPPSPPPTRVNDYGL